MASPSFLDSLHGPRRIVNFCGVYLLYQKMGATSLIVFYFLSVPSQQSIDIPITCQTPEISVRKGSEHLNGHFSKEYIQMTNKYMKRCQQH